MIINKKNLGYGGNIKKCISYAIKNKFDYAVMIHGDGQYSPKYIKSLVKILLKNNYFASTGSRLKSGVKSAIFGGMPIYKLIGNIFLTKFLILFLIQTLRMLIQDYGLIRLIYLKR